MAPELFANKIYSKVRFKKKFNQNLVAMFYKIFKAKMIKK